MPSTTTASTTAMKAEVPPVITLLMLPRDLIWSCLARVSILYYPTLTLVSKSFRSLLNSPELYEMRSLLGRTESRLYVCLQFQHDRSTHWLTLCRKPDQTTADSSQTNMLGDKILVPIPSLDSPPLAMSGVVAVGSNMYATGGSIEDVSSSSVFVMDSHSQTWSKASSMHVARVSPSASVVDGKIYVVGGCKNFDHVNWMEVYDTKTQTWELVPSPGEEMSGSFRDESVGLEGSVYVHISQKKHSTFKLHKGRWRVADIMLNDGLAKSSHEWRRSSYCVIENVLYCCYKTHGVICWYDFNDRIWRELEGLKGRLPKFPKIGYVQMADYGGKLGFLWEEYVPSRNTTSIWFAEISIERRQRWKICGTVEWCGFVFTNTKRYDLMHVLATTA